MRTIKFRAWDKNEKVMFNIRSLEFFHPEAGFSKESRELASVVRHNEDRLDDSPRKFYNLANDYELMQFTGLLDKNGKEIYEGDILRILYSGWISNPAPNNEGLEEYKKSISEIGVVEFDWDRWVVNMGTDKWGSDSIGSIREGQHGEKEVTGNIYENPELLTN